MAPVWVLNLDRSPDRWAQMELQLRAAGLRYERVAACDASTLDAEAIAAIAGPSAESVQPWLGRALTRSEIGCAVSHARLWRRLATGPDRCAVILEDDVEIGATVPDVLRALENDGVERGLVLLGHHSSRRPWIPAAPFDHVHGALTTFRGRQLTKGARVGRVVEYAQGAYGYFLTRETAARLLTIATPIRMPADSVTGYAPAFGVRSYAVTPPCIVPTSALPTTMTDPRPCPCRVCVQRRMSSATAASDAGDRCLAEHSDTRETLRSIGGRAFLFARRLGVRPGSFWAPVLR